MEGYAPPVSRLTVYRSAIGLHSRIEQSCKGSRRLTPSKYGLNGFASIEAIYCEESAKQVFPCGYL